MKRSRFFLATGFALLLGAGVAAAQVFIPGGGLLARAEQREQAFAATLDLTPSQSEAWQQLRRQRLQFALAVRTDLATAKTQVRNDLANPAANLHGTAATIRDLVDHDIAQHRQLQDAQLRFYDQLDPQQQAKLREHMIEKIDRLEQVRQDLLDIAATLQG